MIERTIDWCNANRFLVFIAVAAWVVGGIWSLNLIPLDALPDISDVQVIIHTEWMGQPPNIIEDQVTYPIVTTMPAAPHVKAFARRPCSMTRMCSWCSRTALTSIGRAAVCSNICSSLRPATGRSASSAWTRCHGSRLGL
jgi:AcrB/AcrD/AcrF family